MLRSSYMREGIQQALGMTAIACWQALTCPFGLGQDVYVFSLSLSLSVSLSISLSLSLSLSLSASQKTRLRRPD